MIGALFFLVSCGLLYFVLRYRVHVYIVTQPVRKRLVQPARVTGSRSTREDLATPIRNSAASARTSHGSIDPRRALLVDALVNLGAKRRAASLAADLAIAASPSGSLDELVRAAIKEATEAA